MNDTFLTVITDLGGIAVALTAIAGLSFTVVKYGIIRPIKNYIDDATKELKPNGGSHLADAITRTDERVDSLVSGQDQLLEIMLNHLQDHAKQVEKQ